MDVLRILGTVFPGAEEIVTKLGEHPGVKTLYLNFHNLSVAGGLNLEALRKVTAAAKELEELGLYQATEVSQAELKQLFEVCPKLKKINLWVVGADQRPKPDPVVLKRDDRD